MQTLKGGAWQDEEADGTNWEGQWQHRSSPVTRQQCRFRRSPWVPLNIQRPQLSCPFHWWGILDRTASHRRGESDGGSVPNLFDAYSSWMTDLSHWLWSKDQLWVTHCANWIWVCGRGVSSSGSSFRPMIKWLCGTVGQDPSGTSVAPIAWNSSSLKIRAGLRSTSTV